MRRATARVPCIDPLWIYISAAFSGVVCSETARCDSCELDERKRRAAVKRAALNFIEERTKTGLGLNLKNQRVCILSESEVSLSCRFSSFCTIFIICGEGGPVEQVTRRARP